MVEIVETVEGEEDPAVQARLSTYVGAVWRICLGRDIPEADLGRILLGFAQGLDPVAFFLSVATSPEAQQRASDMSAAPLRFPPGHYYSPIVNPRELSARKFADQLRHDSLNALAIDYTAMEAHFRSLMDATADLQLPVLPTVGWRYHSHNEMYGIGDAAILCGVVRHFRPRRWIEIGSGFSTAVLLDVIDRTAGLKVDVTIADPDLSRVRLLCSDADQQRVCLIEDIVQNLPLSMFECLAAGDGLFIDSTHLSKTGSDVNHEIFQILPRLQSGVLVHFHDVFAGFEYPEIWIYDENRSWNEQYILRAFLMYNTDFEILYANDDFTRARRDVVAAVRPEILVNPGGSLWLRRK